MQVKSFDKYTRGGAYHWRQVSGSWRWHNASVAGRFQAALNAALPVAGKRVLDIGCGDGVLGYDLARHGAQVWGVDLEFEGVTLAREALRAHHVHDVHVLQSSGMTLPFAAETFDTVVCTEVIEHVEQPEELLQEIARVLTRGGKAVVTTPCRITEYPLDRFHVQEFFPDEMKAMVAKYFDDVEIHLSQPLAIRELYQFRFPLVNRALFHYLFNLFSVLGYNPFLLNGFKIYVQMTIVARKAAR